MLVGEDDLAAAEHVARWAAGAGHVRLTADVSAAELGQVLAPAGLLGAAPLPVVEDPLLLDDARLTMVIRSGRAVGLTVSLSAADRRRLGKLGAQLQVVDVALPSGSRLREECSAAAAHAGLMLGEGVLDLLVRSGAQTARRVLTAAGLADLKVLSERQAVMLSAGAAGDDVFRRLPSAVLSGRPALLADMFSREAVREPGGADVVRWWAAVGSELASKVLSGGAPASALLVWSEGDVLVKSAAGRDAVAALLAASVRLSAELHPELYAQPAQD